MCNKCIELMNKIAYAKRQGYAGLASMYLRDLEKHQAQAHNQPAAVQWKNAEWIVRG
jgi:hypothetical protein